MVLYSISFVLMLLACIIAGYQKRGWKWSTRLPMYIVVSAVLALPTMLPLMFFLMCLFDIDAGDRK